MRFDVNRLSVLAGLPASKAQKLNEASNRSYHDDPSLAAERDIQYGKNQLAEEVGSMSGDELPEGDVSEETSFHFSIFEDADEDATSKDEATSEQAEIVYEVDAQDLKEELAKLRMRVQNQRKQTLQEASLKRIIEQEVKNVFKQLEDGELDLNITGNWVYGNNKPRNSRKGQIARGFKSIGFK